MSRSLPITLVAWLLCFQSNLAAATSESIVSKISACRDSAEADAEAAIMICSSVLIEHGLSKTHKGQIFHYRGRAHEKMGAFEKAIDDQSNAILLSPESPALFYHRGISNYKIGAFDEAIGDFDKAVSLRPNHRLSYGWRGHAKLRSQDYDNAKDDYIRSFCKGTEHFGLFDGLGLANYLNGDFHEAITHASIAISKNENFPNAYFHRSLAHRQLRNSSEVEADRKRILAIDPGFLSNPSFLRFVQGRLKTLGYYQGPIDGQIREQLIEAANAFLIANDLERRETIGFDLVDALESVIADKALHDTNWEKHSHQPHAEAAADIPIGRGNFLFSNWEGPKIRVWTYKPSRTGPLTPVVIVMHGSERNGARHRDRWSILADRDNFIVVAPEFSKTSFPKSTSYNLGNVFKGKRRDMNGQDVWAFSSIEPLFDHVVDALDGEQSHYYLFGHSAGAQFVHRFLFYKPDARVARAFPANAGWYILPTYEEKFPYGALASGLHVSHLQSAFARDVVILLGDRDTKTDGKSPRRSKGAMRQGPHRLARGKNFFAAAETQADSLQTPFNWQLEVVEGVGHRSGPMACAAVRFIN